MRASNKKTIKKVKEGALAPSFTLTDQRGRTVSLQSLKTNYTVIYFYPKDDTPGCTIEAKGFNTLLSKLKRCGAQIIGISAQDSASKDKFCKKYRLKLQLLSDPKFEICKKYDAYGTKKFMGRSYKGIFRKTFLLDKKKRVIKIFDKVTPDEHPQEVLDYIQQL